MIETANALNHLPVSVAPTQLVILLQSVSPRFMLERANASNSLTIGLSHHITNDTTPPGVFTQPTMIPDATGAWIGLNLPEYATVRLSYGTSPGVYDQDGPETLLIKQGYVFMPGIVVGTVYYYQMQFTDREGNSSQYEEYSFMINLVTKIFLPMSRKR